MKTITLPLPESFGIAVTRGMLGAGVALLLCDHLDRGQRRKLGTALALIGFLSTAPFAADVLHRAD